MKKLTQKQAYILRNIKYSTYCYYEIMAPKAGDDLDYVAITIEDRISSRLGEKIHIKPTFKEICTAVTKYGLVCRNQACKEYDDLCKAEREAQEEANEIYRKKYYVQKEGSILDKILNFFGGK